jgi:ectoine hydroxylase-related dioxygenase (phytanoyl-CoA dioxygenase family)
MHGPNAAKDDEPFLERVLRLSKDDAMSANVAREIDNHGFAALRKVLPPEEIAQIREAAEPFYSAAEQNIAQFPRAYLYNPGNMAVSMSALDDYGTKDYQLLRTVAKSEAAKHLRHLHGDDVLCSLTHSRMRKSYPQSDQTKPRPSTVEWHQDGSEQVGYYGAYILWVPFTPCNRDYPGLEFQSPAGETIAVDLAPGDALLFNDKTLHRTADCPTSSQCRYSCDMRFFRLSDIPMRVHQKVAQEPLLSVRAFSETVR